MSKRRSRLRLSLILALLVLVAGGFAYKFYQFAFLPNVQLSDGKQYTYVYIKTGSDMEQALEQFFLSNVIRNEKSLTWLAQRKNYVNHVHPGKYRIENGMCNNELVNLLRSGQQEPVKLTFNSVRTLPQLAGKIASQLELDSLALLNKLRNDKQLKRDFGLSSRLILTLFLPNTYEVYWNVSVNGLLKRMAKEYKKFWSNDRKKKAHKLGLSQSEVAILASIVQAEQLQHREERPIIAGLYLNRLKRGIALQSDPTLIYALGDFSIRRVLNEDKKVDSPYNTYRYRGLPPGVINLPEPISIDAVLNAKQHDYLFMCAKDDFSGLHSFSKTLRQHNIYAQRYRQALNKRNIRR